MRLYHQERHARVQTATWQPKESNTLSNPKKLACVQRQNAPILHATKQRVSSLLQVRVQSFEASLLQLVFHLLLLLAAQLIPSQGLLGSLQFRQPVTTSIKKSHGSDSCETFVRKVCIDGPERRSLFSPSSCLPSDQQRPASLQNKSDSCLPVP